MKSGDQTLPQVSQNELQAMAYTDPLPGLGNRYRMRDKVRMLAAERADDPAPFTIGKIMLADGPVVRTLLVDAAREVEPGTAMATTLVAVGTGDDGQAILDLRFKPEG